IARDRKRTRRIVTGLSRNFDVPDLMYELTADGAMVALGSPDAVSMPEVQAAVLGALSTEYQTTKELYERLPESGRPSMEQFRRALKTLALPRVDADGVTMPQVERDPPIEVREVKGVTLKWRATAVNLTSNYIRPVVG